MIRDVECKYLKISADVIFGCLLKVWELVVGHATG